MGIRLFGDYFAEYKEFYESVLKLARMENKFSEEEVTFEQAKKYQELERGILSQCPEGTDIEDLIGLVVVGESRKKIIK